MNGRCRVCGRELDDCGTCVCVTSPAPRSPDWSWVTKEEVISLRLALHEVRQIEVLRVLEGPGLTQEEAAKWRGAAAVLANVVEELLADIFRRRPPDEAQDDVFLARRTGEVCRCLEPGCGRTFRFLPGQTTRDRCYVCSLKG